ncbi:muropeptide MFS transporter AmpG [Dickeya dianthicola]|uniref:muropeptide MFS transporter AmpG n=1 Tax=Dickeya dianthicola TaxID=204039 RepID=UPI00136DB3B3|nr:muropeptide MFS transporter AmpG [Dickeya dianthicola]MCI4236212.1 muropeptide MFS transporter AmpG [Dickeya dianthicola]MCI4253498.1 muropeptide MFS transporter AmpG [Dickeya dianthicola]MZG20497.1 muropeptide MFS transporter AmpG [Dickeya dianthicola]MZI89313.1 muropeptide MFS transporter AmpG [Dickeya dianthicola]
MLSRLLSLFRERNSVILLILGFASGLPLALTSGTLQAWMTVENVDLKTIGFFSLVGQAYVFKFLWSPLMDRYTPPFMGRRRGWLLVTQLSLVAAIVFIGTLTPSHHLWWLAVLAVIIAFCSASQDIVFDAYKTDLLPPEERGSGAAISVLGYRLAMLVSGGLALWIADRFLGWQATYWLMAGLLLLCTLATWLSPEPAVSEPAPRSLEQAVFAPLKDFFSRNNAWLILMLIVLYKLGDAFAASLSTTFLIRGVGFNPGEVGLVNKTLGLFATIIGALFGGVLMQRWTLFRSLMLFGLLQAVSNAGYWLLAVTDKQLAIMASAVFLENLCGGMGTAAFVALLMTLCNKSFSATQFALLSALSAVGRVYVGPIAGWFVELYGWAWFYLFSIIIAIPGLLLLKICRPSLEQAPSGGNFTRRNAYPHFYTLASRLFFIGCVLFAGGLLAWGMLGLGWLGNTGAENMLMTAGAILAVLAMLLGGTLDYLSSRCL